MYSCHNIVSIDLEQTSINSLKIESSRIRGILLTLYKRIELSFQFTMLFFLLRAVIMDYTGSTVCNAIIIPLSITNNENN